MTSGWDSVRRPDPDDVNATFAAIVAGYDDEVSDPVPRWPVVEDADDPAARHHVVRPGQGQASASGGTATAPGTGQADGAADPVPSDQDRDPAPAPDFVGDDLLADHHYVPPEPPPLPRGDAISRLAWAGVLGAPTVLVLLGLVGRGVDGWVGVLLIAAFLVGFGTVVMRRPDGPPPDDSDDGGAVV